MELVGKNYNKKKELNDICLEEFICPCLTYALKRATDGMTRYEFEALPKFDLPEDEEEIPVGTILYWENAEGERAWQLTVEDRPVFTTYSFNRGHFGVYAGDGVFSDLGWSEDGSEPYIRFRKYRETSKPDKMIIIR